MKKCKKCKGTGKVLKDNKNDSSFFTSYASSNYRSINIKTCQSCYGKGFHSK